MRRLFQFGIVSLWLVLPLTAIQYTRVWNELPARVATHFNAANQANGWMTRTESLQYAVGFTACLLALFTVILLYTSRRNIDTFSWAALGFCALVLGILVDVNRSIVNYNLFRTSLALEIPLIAIPIAAILLMTIYVASRRGPALPSTSGSGSDLLAEETHRSGIMALLVVPAMLGPAIAASLVPAPALRVSLGLVGLVGFAATIMAWSGFQYRFLRHGLEIRTLGFRLRSIPRMQIQSYSAESWNLLRGYGIRGIGNRRSYVWGNKVVHIKTLNGDIFLGHSDPQRIVRDLDRVMSN
jgi:Protein of unknown function (DUF1648)